MLTALNQAELTCALDGRGPTLHPEFAVNAPQMPPYRARADVQGLGHLGVRESPGDERENFQLAAAEEASRRTIRLRRLPEYEGERLLERHFAALCPDGSAFLFGQGLPRRFKASPEERFRVGSYGHSVGAAQRRRRSPEAKGTLGFPFGRSQACESLPRVRAAPGKPRQGHYPV